MSLIFLANMHKYAWVIPFKDKNCNKITNAFQEVLNESRRKQNKIWVHKGIEFFNRTMKSSLQDNDTGIHSSHNEGKFV